jgi:hemoglobin
MPAEQLSSSSTLYDRIGGHEGIMRLITPFYAKVRHDPMLGPVFNTRIADWPSHLAKITEFWARMTGGPSAYAGGMGRHLSLGIDERHFAAWLALWDENAKATLPEAEAGEMSRLAHGIGDDLARMIARYRQPQFGVEAGG